jgi:uncharacterized protein YodC (DUF2158 family)
MAFKVGDTVQLKSGGPIMTIEHIGTYGAAPGANCTWFEKEKAVSRVFTLESLKEASPPAAIQTGRLTR